MHYANVDTGAQVCTTMALLKAFPRLSKYYKPDQGGGIVGIGRAVTMVGLLVDVLLHVGPGPIDPRAVVQTTFCILEGDKCMMIFVHEFLTTVHGLVDVTHHRL